MTRYLAYLSISTLIAFIPFVEIIENFEGLAGSFISKILIVFFIFTINIPWAYALNKAIKYGDKKLFWYCFLFTSASAWYFLFKINNKYEKTTH